MNKVAKRLKELKKDPILELVLLADTTDNDKLKGEIYLKLLTYIEKPVTESSENSQPEEKSTLEAEQLGQAFDLAVSAAKI